MNSAALFRTETETVAATTARLAGLERELPKILDTFFLLMYATGEQDKANPDRMAFHSLAWNTFLEVPYTIRCCYLNAALGYYGQSLILLRHLLEATAKVEYARKNNGLSERIWAAPGDAGGDLKPLSISSIFAGIGRTELYNTIYGTLSTMTHGGATIGMFRLQREAGEVTQVRQAMAYDEFHGTYVMNMLLTIALALMYRFPLCFPKGWEKADEETRKSYDASLLWLEQCRDSLLKVNPKFQNTIDRFGELIQKS